MRKFLSCLILLAGLTFCSDLKAGEWSTDGEPAPASRLEMDRQKKERIGIYSVMALAALIGLAAVVQFAREIRDSFAGKKRYAEERNFDD